MSQPIPARRLAVEGLVIVISILLAFAIDAWWDGRQEREVEQRLLQALHADMSWTRDSLNALMPDLERRSDAMSQFLESAPEALLTLSDDSARVIIRLIERYTTFEPRDASLRAYDPAILRSPGLRDVVGEWSRRAANAAEASPLLRDAQRDLQIGRGQAWLDFRDRGSASPGLYLGEARSDGDFRLLVTWKRNQANTQLNKLRQLLDATEDVLAALASANR